VYNNTLLTNQPYPYGENQTAPIISNVTDPKTKITTVTYAKPVPFNASLWYDNFVCESTIPDPEDWESYGQDFSTVILSNYDLNAPVKTRYDIYPPSFNVTDQYDWDNDGDSDYNYTYSYNLFADGSDIEDWSSVKVAA